MTSKLRNILKNHTAFIAIIFVFSLLTIPNIGHKDLLDWDECVFAQQAKEMLQTGNLLTNQWNRQILFEKPPLTTLLVRSSYVFGINEFTARLPILLVSLATLVAIYLFGLYFINKRTALMSVLLLISTKFYILYSTQVNSDVVFTFFTFLGVLCWEISMKKSKYSYIAGVLFGLAVMSKGLSIFPYLIAIFISISFDYSRERLINFIKMITIFLIVIIPWHLYEYLNYGQKFIQVYIVEHLIRRAQYPIDFHIEGRSFYILRILENFGSWLVFMIILPVLYLNQWRKYISLAMLQKELRTKQVIFTILLLIMIPLISITQVRTRIWWYVLPIYPFIAIFIAYNIDLFLKKINVRSSVLTIFLVTLLSISSLYLVLTEMQRRDDPASKVTKRDEIFKKISKEPIKDIYYLVWFPERQGRKTLPDTMHTSTTFIFGGNPCAVYYSNKKIKYIYDIDKFKSKMNEKMSRLFVIENGDLWILKDQQVKVYYRNSDFTVFRI